MMISIDPGVHDTGVAIWFEQRQELDEAFLVRSEGPWDEMGRAVAKKVKRLYGQTLKLVVFEHPQVYVRSRSKGDPNDLILLALVCGFIVGALGVPTVSYKPADWKGQVPKDVMTRRIQSVLTQKEIDRVEIPTARSLAHNVWDAVGIGLHHLRRRYVGEGSEGSNGTV